MSEYQEYTITLGFTAALGSKLQSDTIFGQICWAIRYLMGEGNLKDFLNSYGKDIQSPLLVSNGFPSGCLPKPIMPPVTQEEIQAVVSANGDERVHASHKITTIKKMDIVPKKVLQKFQQTLLNPAALFTALYEDTTYTSILKADEGQTTAVVQHNTIDRVLGSVRRGGLYTQEDTFFDPASTVFEIYLKTSLFSKAELIKLFRFISIEGFGRDGSTGKGHFEFSIDEGISLPEAEKPNAFMTLSSYIPTVNDPVKGYYGIVHKYGKLGGLYARGIDEVRGNPFKVPIIMFSAGSTFFDQSYHKDKIYGGLIGAVHQNEHIRHYAYAFPLGVNIEEKYENL